MENRIGYGSLDNYKHQINVWYKIYNISREKTELFHDFLISLYDTVNDTYLGADILIYEEDQKNHFKWCWNKVITNFSKERIYFKADGNYFEYFWNLFLEAFYLTLCDGGETKIKEYFFKLFDFNYIKSRSELDIVVHIYKLLEQNLKK